MRVKYTVSQAHALLTAEMLLKMGVSFAKSKLCRRDGIASPVKTGHR